MFYMAGFCPEGPECKKGVHLKEPGPGATVSKPEERDNDGDSRMDDGERDERRGGNENWRGRGRYTGKGRWRNKR